MRPAGGVPGGAGLAEGRPPAHDDGCQTTPRAPGAGHAILAPAPVPDPRLPPPGPLARPPHRPPPAPGGGQLLSGHVWVPLAPLAPPPAWGPLAPPLPARPYIRRADLPELPPDRRRPFRTKLELAAEELAWLKAWAGRRFAQFWA